MSSESKPKKWVTSRIPIWLDPIVSKFAAQLGISKGEALGRMFKIAYPTGDLPTSMPGDFLQPPTEMGKVVGVPPSPTTPGISDTLQGTVRDLTAVKTINALSKDFGGEGGGESGLNLTKEGFELKKLETMFPQNRQQGVSPEMTQLTQQMQALMQQNQNLQQQIQNLQVDTQQKETDRWRERALSFEKKEERNQELAPLYDRIGGLGDAINNMNTQIAELGKAKATTPVETQAKSEILQLAVSIKDGMETMAANISKGSIGLSEVESLINVVENIKSKLLPKEAGGELSPVTMAISTFGEVGREFIREYGKMRRQEEETAEATGKQIPIKTRVIERQVLNYVTRLIESGKGEINAYEAAKELGCTPEEVYMAVESLKKKGLITFGQKEKPQEETKSRVSEAQLRKLEEEGKLISD